MRTIGISRTAAAIARRIEKAGLAVTISESRRSDSRYLYVALPEDEASDLADALTDCGLAYLDRPDLPSFDVFRQITLRVSDHPNPARRFDRVSGGLDRACEVDIEVRTDRDSDWRAAADQALESLRTHLAAIREL